MSWYIVSSTEKSALFNHDIVLVKDWDNGHIFRDYYPFIDWNDLESAIDSSVAFVNHPATGITHLHMLSPQLYKLAEKLLNRQLSIQDLTRDQATELRKIGLIYNPHQVELQKHAWYNHLIECKTNLAQNNWAKIEKLFDPRATPTIRAYYERNKSRMKHGDRQSANRIIRHNDPLMQFYHQQISHRLENNVFAEDVTPSYCYVSIYHSQSDLPKHTDREQCRWNLSVLLDSDPNFVDPEDGWPIYIDIDGNVVKAEATIGDAIIYRGNKYPHWREKLPEKFKQMTVCFMHFVRKDFEGDKC